MKNQLPEYFKPSDDEVKNLWQNATIVLDANVLLNLFRYSTKSREELIKILQYYQDRIWVPYQVAFEFLENSISVPASLSKSLSDTLKAIDSITGVLEGKLNLNQYDKYHLLKPDDLRKDIKRFQDKLHEKVEKIQKEYDDIDKDAIVKQITELLDGRVGQDFSEKDLNNVFKEGEKRYNEKTPPGYEDLKTKKEAPKRHLYGDYIWWVQVINYANENHKDIVIVTDDSKEDWWYKINSEIISPRVELIKEFRNSTGDQKFHMYRTARFMELAKKYDGVSISDTSIKEVKAKSSHTVLSSIDWNSFLGQTEQDQNALGITSRLHSFYGGGMPAGSEFVDPQYRILGYHGSPVQGSAYPYMVPNTDSNSLMDYVLGGEIGGKGIISPITGITGVSFNPKDDMNDGDDKKGR